MESSELTEQALLSLTRAPDTGALTAKFCTSLLASAPSRQTVMDALASQGWAGAALEERALADFLKACEQAQNALVALATQTVAENECALADSTALDETNAPAVSVEPTTIEAVIGKVLDGGVKIAIAADKMRALMDLWPAQGGRAVTLDDIRAAAKAAGVGIALDEDTLQAAFAQGHAMGVVIAKGQPAQFGTPTSFESMIDSLRPKFAEPDDKERVDFRTLGTLLIVSPGQVLMRRIPAKQGWPGTDVLGKSIPVPRVPDAGYARGLTGVAFDENDPNVLRAAISGSPVVVHHGVKVNPVIEIDAVDLSTGNIEFDGALRVRGDIKRNMNVQVSGDVIVQGAVEAANISAGGNITVEGGIIGHDGGAQEVSVSCKGTLQARFVNHAKISAGVDVVVEREIVNSEVLAGGQVSVGVPGATRGGIAGGRCCALTLVRAPRLGTPGGIATHVQVGMDPHADRRRAELEVEREKLKAERTKIEQLMAFLKANPGRAVGGVAERSKATHLKILEELAALDLEAAQIAKDIMRTTDVAIEADQQLYSGVILQVANRRYELLDDYGRCRAIWHDDAVVVNTMS